MKHVTDQIAQTARKHNCIIIYPGDIFHHWKASPELINWALAHLPLGYSIAGQHDLPYHDLGEIKKSAYWTLVKGGVLKHLPYNSPKSVTVDDTKMQLFGFSFGKKVSPCSNVDKPNGLKVAVIHRYTWTGGHVHPGAKEEDHVSKLDEKLTGFKCAVVGDNHSGFMYGNSKTQRHILNCGTVMRRRSDEKKNHPWLGLIHANGRIAQHYLNIKHEVWDNVSDDVQVLKDMGVDIEDFVETLSMIEETAIDFGDAITEFIRRSKTSHRVVRIIRAALEAARAKGK